MNQSRLETIYRRLVTVWCKYAVLGPQERAEGAMGCHDRADRAEMLLHRANILLINFATMNPEVATTASLQRWAIYQIERATMIHDL